ncbi:hypothetical protein JCM33374_g4597 [Metschnikowia sp. JCM 33374]|nr:hypothetical protein JCM33374_g4597 [Metschnikowia sp. JCM 33374]
MGNAKSSNVAHTATPTHIMEESQEAFRQLLPLLKSVDASNSDGLLVTFLKEYHSEVPLASLYHLLYTSDSPDDIPPLSIPDSDFDQPDVSARTTKGLQLCHFILEAFKSPETFQGGIVHNPTLGTVNFHEFLRSFLAIKILFGSLKQVEKPNMSVSRVSLYKVYYILCQKLIHKSHNDSESWRSQQSIIFGESKMGKIFKLVYPNSKKKRLGKRGESKLHYVGFKWNDSMVDDEIRSLLNLRIA